MHITLLPPLLPSEGVVPVSGRAQLFTPGSRILATVLATGLDGGTLLSLGGRELPTGSALPYPKGTILRLEVVAGGAQPQLRLVAVESSPAPSTDDEVAHPALPAGPPVSAATYGLAAAVLAAREGADVRSAAMAVVRWMPALVASGVLTSDQAEALMKALAPVPVHTAHDGAPATEAVARAIADRVANGGLLLERRLADVVDQKRPAAASPAAADVRSRLAVVAHLLEQASPGFEAARQSVTGLQDAMLAEQARTAAYLARDGVVDLRIPLQIEGQAAEMRLRMQIQRDDEPRTEEGAVTPWRQVRLDLALEGLGRIQVRLAVQAAQVRAEFLVEHPGTADRIEAGLATLADALEGAGFAQVLSRIVVDPVRVCAPDDLPDLPPQHTILDARA